VSDKAIIVSAVALAIVVILFLVRERLSRFAFKANRDGLETEIETNLPRGDAGTAARARSIRVSNNRQEGTGHRIEVARGSVEVEGNIQAGSDQKISVGRDDERNPS